MRKNSLPERSAAITFDDGYADNLEYALPVLQRYRLHATFFIASGFIGGGRMWNDTVIESVRSTVARSIDASFLGLGELAVSSVEEKRAALSVLIPSLKHLKPGLRSESVCRLAETCEAKLPSDLMLTHEQLLALRDAGMTIGAHTVSHPILATLNDSGRARREIADSRDFPKEHYASLSLYLLIRMASLVAITKGNTPTWCVPSVFRLPFSTNWGVCSNKSDVFQLPRFTPWDAPRWRFGLRMLRNFRVNDAALQSYAPKQE